METITQTNEKWIDRKRSAVDLLNAIGLLMYDKNIELVLFRSPLIDQSVPELLNLHEYAKNIVNKPINRDWVQFHIETGEYDVEATSDYRALDNNGRRMGYRFEVQGPNANAILEKLNGGPIVGFKFFGMGTINIAGRTVRALRHGMAGAVGLELFGPFDDYDLIRDAIFETFYWGIQRNTKPCCVTELV
jgi:glycine cleavage system aminomethyltransferase T